jgi:hypothetical protein
MVNAKPHASVAVAEPPADVSISMGAYSVSSLGHKKARDVAGAFDLARKETQYKLILTD